ncbi:MAG TPA: sensor domain-containing diguanylate cyclase [Thermoanaerobaculia bacterium]|nr:sensor domain-containing diguanylate cyclase [Thermoanaerobaculia bacterium]
MGRFFMSSRFRSLSDCATLRQLVHKLPAAVYISTGDGQILDANPWCLRLFGVESLEELRRYQVTDLLADPERRDEELTALGRSGALGEYELQLRRPDGEVRTVIDTCYLVVDPESGEQLLHGILVDVTDRKQLEQRLRELSIRDPLTGCLNRRYLGQLEADLATRGVRWGTIVADIDHFKRYNDEQGHEAGDRVLVEVGRYLTLHTRPGDAVIRLGGDEFLVVVPRQAPEAVPRILQRLRRRGARTSPPVPLSTGWALREGDEPLERTVARADRQLLSGRAAERRLPPPSSVEPP